MKAYVWLCLFFGTLLTCQKTLVLGSEEKEKDFAKSLRLDPAAQLLFPTKAGGAAYLPLHFSVDTVSVHSDKPAAVNQVKAEHISDDNAGDATTEEKQPAQPLESGIAGQPKSELDKESGFPGLKDGAKMSKSLTFWIKKGTLALYGSPKGGNFCRLFRRSSLPKDKWDVESRLPKTHLNVGAELCKAHAELTSLLALYDLTDKPTMPSSRYLFKEDVVPGIEAVALIVNEVDWETGGSGKMSFLSRTELPSASEKEMQFSSEKTTPSVRRKTTTSPEKAGIIPPTGEYPVYELRFHYMLEGHPEFIILKRLVSTQPFTYEVLVNNDIFLLDAFPVAGQAEEIRKTVVRERRRTHSFVELSRKFKLSTGEQLLRGCRWNLFLDVLEVYGHDKKVVRLPDGNKVANHFILRRMMAATLRQCVRRMEVVEYIQAGTVYAARSSLTLQLFRLMSVYTAHDIVFVDLSLDSFELGRSGLLYISTVAPWYDSGRFRCGADANKEVSDSENPASKSRLISIAKGNVPALVHLIVSVWCGEAVGESVPVNGFTGDDSKKILEIIEGLRNSKSQCVPYTVHTLLASLLSNINDDSQFFTSDIPEQPYWQRIEEEINSALQLASPRL